MRQANVSVYGSNSCPDTRRVLKFLDAQSIPYEFKDLDEVPEFQTYIANLNDGKPVMPTVQVENEFYFNPDLDTLIEAVQAASVAR